MNKARNPWRSTTTGQARSPAACGFTLVEFIVIIVLLGIVGAVIASRLSAPRAFDLAAARDAVAATAQAAQQLSLGRQDVTFAIQDTGGEWVVSAKVAGSEQGSRSFSSGGIVLETGPTAPSANDCGSAFDTAVASDFEVSYDARGNAVQLVNNGISEPVDNGIRICLNDSRDLSLCISPGGFVKLGDCDD